VTEPFGPLTAQFVDRARPVASRAEQNVDTRLGGAALTALGGAAPAAPASTQRPVGRPHSHVVTYDGGDLHVQRLQMAVMSSRGRLRARVALTVRNETRRPIARELRIGRCVGGAPAAPVCAPTRSVRVRLGAGEQRSFTARVTLARPPARTDAVQAALVRRTARQSYAFRSDGLLLLSGSAWRGAGAGRTYGVALAPGDGARRLSFDIPLTAPGRAFIDVKWQGTAAPAGAATTISRCTRGTCTPQPLPPARAHSGPRTFGNRLDFQAQAADSIGLRAVSATGGPPLFDATLPWPESSAALSRG
jgi:hypothetical protein